MPSIAEQVIIYVKKKPYVQEALEQNIVNFSALSRAIVREIDGAKFDAVKAALVRAGIKLRKERLKQEKKAIELLDNSRFSIQNKIAITRSKEPLKVNAIAETRTTSGYLYVMTEKNMAQLKNLKLQTGLSMISVLSPPEIESIPGVIALIYSALASEKINICETLSCGEDTLIIVNEYDAPLAFSALAERMRV